jgi:hypothetical protein
LWVVVLRGLVRLSGVVRLSGGLVVARRVVRREVAVVLVVLAVRWLRWAKAMVVIRGVVHGPVVSQWVLTGALQCETSGELYLCGW